MQSPRSLKPGLISISHAADQYGSLPGTPFGLEARPHDMALALEQARMNLEAPDYFSGVPRYGCNLRPRSPFPSSYDHERYSGYGHEADLNETVRRYAVAIRPSCNLTSRLIYMILSFRTNLAVALVNGSIGHKAQYSQVHPFMCHDGRFPQDFQIPRTVESMKILDSEFAHSFLLVRSGTY